MEEFIDYAKVIMGVLGHKLFEPFTKPMPAKQEIVDPVAEDIAKLYLKRTIKGIGAVEATGSQTAEGFVVFAGSHISPEDDHAVPETLKKQRKSAPVDADGNLTEDMLFSSPSYAAMFVIGKSANGLTSWKDADGNTLKSLEADE